LEVELFRLHDYHVLWLVFPHYWAKLLLPLYLIPRPQKGKPFWFRLFRVRSPLLAESLLFSFPSGTEMVHFPEFALPVLYIQTGVIGFPHSEIDGSSNMCFSPSLIAAFHVLHRLEVPRHSPYALSSLTIKLAQEQILYVLYLSCYESNDLQQLVFLYFLKKSIFSYQISKSAKGRINNSSLNDLLTLLSPNNWWRRGGSNP
jgi:hypothetical protein